MKLKYILQGTLSLLITTSFTACGGGGGGSGNNASFKNSETLIPITINCVTTPNQTDIDTYIPLQSGDVVVKDDENTSVSIYHDIFGVKKICLESGNAHIVRK